MSEDVSRRKALSLLGLGAALGFALSSALEPLEAEAQEAAPALPPPHPLRPGHTGCSDVQRAAPLAISDGTRAAPVNLHPPQQLQRNRRSVCFQTPDCAIDGLRVAYTFGGPRNARDRQNS